MYGIRGEMHEHDNMKATLEGLTFDIRQSISVSSIRSQIINLCTDLVMSCQVSTFLSKLYLISKNVAYKENKSE